MGKKKGLTSSLITRLLKLSPWCWAYLLSLPLAIYFFLGDNFNWGGTDEGEFAYHDGNVSWSEIAERIFLPSSPKVFLFGFMRPIPYRLFFKVMSGVFHLNAYQYHVVCWFAGWLSCLVFAWGMVALARLLLPIPKLTIWPVALLTWWTPTYQLITNAVFPDCWLQPAFTALFWGLLYSKSSELPLWLRKPGVRVVLAIFAAFAGCQSHEFGSFLLFWTTGWLFVVRWIRGSRGLEPLIGRSSILWVALPSLFAILYIGVYRGFDPGTANRWDLVISTKLPDLLRIFKYYIMMGTYGVNEYFFKLFNLDYYLIGSKPAGHPWAFIFASIGAFLSVSLAWRYKKDKVERLASWLILGAGVFCVLPFLPMQNRSLIYYALRLNMFVAAFVAIRLFWRVDEHRKVKVIQTKRPLIAAIYATGLFLAAWTVFHEWNWLKQFGGDSKRFYQSVMAIPGIQECTSERPCCLSIPKRGWIYNEWTVNWNDNAPFPPRFLEAGQKCWKTVKL